MRRLILRRILPAHVGVLAAVCVILGFTLTARVGRATADARVDGLIAAAHLVSAGIQPLDTHTPDSESDAQQFVDTVHEATGYAAALFDPTGQALARSQNISQFAVGALVADINEQTEFPRQVVRGDGTAAVLMPLAANRRMFFYLEAVAATELSASPVAGLVVAIFAASLSIVLWATFYTIHKLEEAGRNLLGATADLAAGTLEFEVPAGGPAEIVGAGENLKVAATRLKAQIDDIKSRQNELEAVLSSMVEGVVVLDKERRIRSINQAAARLFDKQSQDASGKTVIEYFRNADLGEVADELFAKRETIERTITVYGRETTYIQVHGTLVVTAEGEESSEILLVLNDISRLRRLEELRKDFVANVSHELKTPITSIKGFVETLIDGAINDRESADRFMEIILHHTNRLGAIIEDLLSLSRLEQDDKQVRFETCDLRVIIRRAVENCSTAATAKEISVSSDVTGDHYAIVSGSLLEQAIVNLLDNAIKYSDPKSHVEVSADCGHKTLSIMVKDEGQGISEQFLPRIFERFYRVDRGRSRNLGGTGLGLAIVKHIALVHQGEVSVESSPGEGSTFAITLPILNEAPPAGGRTAFGINSVGL